jgi:hypothetical protein
MSTQVTVEKNGKFYSVPAKIFGEFSPEDEEFRIIAKEYLSSNSKDYFQENSSPQDLLKQKNIKEAASRLKQVSPVYAPMVPSATQSRMGVGAFMSERRGDTKVPTIIRPSAYLNSEFTPKQDMATVLGVAEDDLDIDSGAPDGLRSFAGFYTNKNQVKSFYENNTGAKYVKLGIDDSEQSFLKYPDGTAIKVDEVGFGFTDVFEFIVPEVAPVGANIFTTTALIVGSKGSSLFYAPVAGAVAETGVREFQSGLFQLTPYLAGLKPPDIEFSPSALAVRSGSEILLNSVIDITTAGFGKFIITKNPFKPIKKDLDDGAKSVSESTKNLSKEIGEPIDDIAASPEAIQRLVNESEEVNNVIRGAQKKTSERFFEIIGSGNKSPEASKKIIQDISIQYANKAQSYLDSIAEEVSKVDADAAAFLIKSTKDRVSGLVSDYGSGSYKLTGGLDKNRSTILSSLNSAGERITKQNKKNYDNVYTVAKKQDEPVTIPLSKIVDAITGSTRKGTQSRLPEKQANTLIETLFLNTLNFKKYTYKTLKELQEDIANKEIDLNKIDISFEDLDSFYKNQKKAFGTLLSSSDRNTRLAEDRIRNLRLNSIKGTEAHEALKEADKYFMDYHQPMYGERGLLTKAADQRGAVPKAAIFENLLPKGNALSSIDNLKSAKRLLDAKEYINYKNSLKLSFLNKHGFFQEGSVGTSFFKKENRELAEEIFGKQTELIYNLAKDLNQRKIKISEVDLDEIIKQNQISPEAGNFLKTQKIKTAELAKKSSEKLSKILFDLDSGKKAMFEDLELAARRTNEDVVGSEKIKDFMIAMKGKNSYGLAYKTEVLSDLIDRVGKSQSSNSFFDASPIIAKITRYPEKYKAIFGEKEYGQILANLKYAKSIEADVDQFYRTSNQATTSVGRVTTGGSGNSQMSYDLLHYIRPRVWKKGVQNKLMAMSMIDGDFDSFFSKLGNPEFKYQDGPALTRALKKYIRSEKWVSVVLGYDNYLSAYTTEFMGLQGLIENEKTSLIEEIKQSESVKYNPAEYERFGKGFLKKSPKQAKPQK